MSSGPVHERQRERERNDIRHDEQGDEQGDEQRHVSEFYARLDRLRAEVRGRLEGVLAARGLGHQGLAERDIAAGELARRAAQLDAVENGLCFGRIDLRDGESRHIGRMGILEDGGEFEPLLIDWRAPAARPFYVATGRRPENVRRRRHIATRGREVTGVLDEFFGAGPEGAGPGGDAAEAALLAAVNSPRTARMTDIVATIQAEQDAIIRAPHAGILVVQGGPGTGKTAVALHRAAYLLYTRRERLARSAVLIVGPNPAFLRYIGEVLPSLGETGVLLATVDRLFPGVTPTAAESPAAAELKGRAAMAEVLAAAVADRQRVPEGEGRRVLHGGRRVLLERDAFLRARRLARETGLPHNQARPVCHDALLDSLADRVAGRFAVDPVDGGSLLSAGDREEIRADLAGDPAVLAVLEAAWPALTPQRLLAGLYSSTARLERAAPALTAEERALLHRPAPAHADWTAADVPLLDEAAELLGPDADSERAAGQRAEAEYGERLALAQEALDVAYGSRDTDFADEEDGEEAEVLSAFDLLDAQALADRYAEGDHRTAAERAAADRTWTFGHVVVDEAQELTAMAWRLLMRRCPGRSMTLVGDIAQTGEPGGAASWERVLAPHVGDRWRQAELTVNYRLPAEIAAVAAGVLFRIDPWRSTPRAVRSTGVAPWRLAVPRAALAREAARLAAAEPGSVALIGPASLRGALARAAGEGVAVLDPRQAKGLEFDAVIVVDPAAIVAESPSAQAGPHRGLNDLYVALTRPTQRLGLLHPDDPAGTPPAGLTRLGPPARPL
ncbi:AAA family ATPase [Streptomyces sp. DSM 44917]|uniref:AAA family ATPase n=1 Tax=Streptomyces boetiae TaxID=3075541 RepID=A0ABU2L869_9ACTN|nr:AAA family ATPase [Streptomyces sp. DSM 44917]MDT0307765.1 AAA family ATPase [Streptomyces sp. DSM 44917]